MRHISQQGLDLICRFEGFSPIIYKCPAGYPTIGYGHLITEKNKEQSHHENRDCNRRHDVNQGHDQQ